MAGRAGADSVLCGFGMGVAVVSCFNEKERIGVRPRRVVCKIEWHQGDLFPASA